MDSFICDAEHTYYLLFNEKKIVSVAFGVMLKGNQRLSEVI